ncbi:hypothetical protein [Puerhibacterium puerhi]|uniref:hypothetical protein n=1 Tax=Puerhibacterium puerhi TaxID=2692623 RepID=UPI001359195B|nr:hypothetical protein [Puerhibacterium puerhi]
MLRKLLGTVLIVLGLVAAGLGVASATVWRQSDTVVATATPQGDGALVVTDPGVLELVDDSVTVRATVPGDGKVTLAVGRDVDVAGWVGDEPYTRVTGLSDWESLAVAAGEPSASPSPAEGQDAGAAAEPAKPSGDDPAGNDMWVAQASGDGTVTLRWGDQPGRWSLLAAGVGDGAQAPTVELTWPRTVTTPWLWPGVIAGVVLVLAGLAVLLVRRRRRGTPAVPDQADEVVPPSDGAQPGEASPGRAEDRTADRAADRTELLAAAADQAPAIPDAAEQRSVPFVGRRSRRASDPSTTAEPPTATPSATPSASVWPATTGASPWPARPGAAPPAGEGAQGDGTQGDATAAPETAAIEVPPVGASAAEPPATTGATPRLTRRELRALEEEARRGAARPITGRLRALTGQIPVVGRGQQAAADQPAAPGAAPATTRAGRAAAWRATWGFDGGAPRPATPQDAPQDGDDPAAGTQDSTEGGSR